MLTESVSRDVMYLYQYLKSDNIDLPFGEPWYIEDWVRSTGYESDDETFDEYMQDSEWHHAVTWLYENHKSKFMEFNEWLKTNYKDELREGNTKTYFDTDVKLIKNQWLVHFTDNAYDIFSEGFNFGTDEIDRLGLTTYRQASKNGIYGFAYLASDIYKGYYLSNTRNKFKYGSEVIMFRGSGVRAYHKSDDEYQVIFDTRTISDIVLIEHTNNTINGIYSDVYAITDKNANMLYKTTDDDNRSLEKCISWVIKNYDNYHKSIDTGHAPSVNNPKKFKKQFESFLDDLIPYNSLLIEAIKQAYYLIESKSLAGDDGIKIDMDGGYIDIQYKNTHYSPRSQSVIDFYVNKEDRNKGIGDKLIKKAMEQFNDLGAQVSSKQSLYLFYKNGFRNPSLGNVSFDEHVVEFNNNGSSLFMTINYDNNMLESVNNKQSDLINELEIHAQNIAEIGQKIYNEWVDAISTNEADYYAGGGICHFIADDICEYLSKLGYDCKTISYDHVQHVACLVRKESDDEEFDVVTVDIPYYLYEIGGGFTWEPIEDVELEARDVTFYKQTMSSDDWYSDY